MEITFRHIVRGPDGQYYNDGEDLMLEDFGGVPPATGDLIVMTFKDSDNSLYHVVYRVLYRTFKRESVVVSKQGESENPMAHSGVVTERMTELDASLKKALGLVDPISAN